MAGLLSIHPHTFEQAWIPLQAPRVTFGSAASTALRVEHGRFEPLHGEFAQTESGHWQFEEYGSPQLTLNGLHREGRVPLKSTDVIAWSDEAPCWAFCETLPHRDPKREEALLEASQDDWLVYGDELQSAGDDLGRLILEGAARLDGELPSVFAEPVSRGVIEFDWCNGLWDAVTLRSRARTHWRKWLGLALALPQGRFVRRVVIEFRQGDIDRVEFAIHLISQARLPVSLQELEFRFPGGLPCCARHTRHEVARWDFKRRQLRRG